MIRFILWVVIGIDVFELWDKEKDNKHFITYWVKDVDGFWIVNSFDETVADVFSEGEMEYRGKYGPFPSSLEAAAFADALNEFIQSKLIKKQDGELTKLEKELETLNQKDDDDFGGTNMSFCGSIPPD